MKVRQWDKEQDYVMLESWWKQWKWQPVPINILPDTGYIVYTNNNSICAGFLYLTNSPMASIEWIIQNKQTTKEERKYTLEFLLENLFLIAKERGCSFIFSSIRNESLKSRMASVGYKETDTNMTSMMKILK